LKAGPSWLVIIRRMATNSPSQMVVCGMAYGFQGAAIGTVQKSLVGRRKISDFNQNSALGRNAINDQGNGEHAPPWRIAKRPTKDHPPRSVDTLRIVVCVTLEAA
jgi:hypothetical protein